MTFNNSYRVSPKMVMLCGHGHVHQDAKAVGSYCLAGDCFNDWGNEPKDPKRLITMINIAELIADDLDYFADKRYPEVTGLRKIKRVRSAKHTEGYSYTFEAEIGGEWLSYGPTICGNYSVRSDCPEWTLPESNDLFKKTSTRTIYLGFYKLDRLFVGLPLEDET